METDIHYCALFRLGRLAGFSPDEAETIAYASQYVDDATESEPVAVFPGQVFDTVRTAHYDLEAFDWGVQKKITMPFHFLPGRIRREVGPEFCYVTRPPGGSPGEPVDMLVDAALAEPDTQLRLIRLGIALHTLADTFAHAGFSGRRHDENRVGEIRVRECGKWVLRLWASYCDVLVPRLGHLEAGRYPDLPYVHWRYDGASGMVERDNVAVTMACLDALYARLRRAGTGESGELGTDHPRERDRLLGLVRTPGNQAVRCLAWERDIDMPRYDRVRWRRDALLGDPVDWDGLARDPRRTALAGLAGKPGFDGSKWAGFHRAAHLQRSLVWTWLN